MIFEKQRQKDIVKWLEEQGCKATQQIFLRRCRGWGASRRPTVSSDDPSLIAANQANEIRQKLGLHRRTRDEADRADARREAFNNVKQAIDEGIVRPLNRETIRKALLKYYHYHAREGDVREALKVLNLEAITARKSEFTPSPTNERVVNFAYSKSNEALLAPFAAVAALGSTPEANEEVRTTLHNLIQFGQARR